MNFINICDSTGNTVCRFSDSLIEATDYEPYEPAPSLTIDDSIDAIRYCVNDCNITKEYERKLNKEKEGISMKLLKLWHDKSIDNIDKYYDKLREEECNKNEVVKDVKKLTEKYVEDMNDLIEKYGDKIVFDECGFADSTFVDIESTDEFNTIDKMHQAEIERINNICEEVTAHAELIPAPISEYSHYEIIDVLKAYGIVDKNGVLTPYHPDTKKENDNVNLKKKKCGRPKKESK